MIEEVCQSNFDQKVLQSKEYVIVEYWTQGCKPCEALKEDIEKLSREYEGKVKFTKLNTAKSRRIAINLNILVLPTVSFYKDGLKIDEISKEEVTPYNIQKMIEKHIKKSLQK